MKLDIVEPIWNIKSVGVNEEYLIGDGDLEIEILYRRKDGSRSYPNVLKVSKQKALAYPTQVIKGVKLYIVPISILQIVEPTKEAIEENQEGKFEFAQRMLAETRKVVNL